MIIKGRLLIASVYTMMMDIIIRVLKFIQDAFRSFRVHLHLIFLNAHPCKGAIALPSQFEKLTKGNVSPPAIIFL